MKKVWCRYHHGYVPADDAVKLRTGRGRGVVGHACTRCNAIRQLPKAERDAVSSQMVQDQKQVKAQTNKDWKTYKKKIKEISQ